MGKLCLRHVQDMCKYVIFLTWSRYGPDNWTVELLQKQLHAQENLQELLAGVKRENGCLFHVRSSENHQVMFAEGRYLSIDIFHVFFL